MKRNLLKLYPQITTKIDDKASIAEYGIHHTANQSGLAEILGVINSIKNLVKFPA